MSVTEKPVELAPVDVAPVSSTSRRSTVVVIIVLVVAVGALIATALLHNLNYFETVDEALSHRTTLGTSVFRLEGVVSKGTVERTSVGANFYLDGNRTKEVYVIESGAPPQLFQENIPVVVAGHFTTTTAVAVPTFVADQIIVKHSSDYIAKHPGRVRAPNGTTR